MNYMIKAKVINAVLIQENGIIRNSEGYLIGRLVEDVNFDSEHINDADSTRDCMNHLKLKLSKEDDYAYGWHANISMMCYDAISSKTYDAPYGFDHGLAHKIGNDAASRFMKLCFNVDTNQDMLNPNKE